MYYEVHLIVKNVGVLYHKVNPVVNQPISRLIYYGGLTFTFKKIELVI